MLNHEDEQVVCSYSHFYTPHTKIPTEVDLSVSL